MRDALPLLPCGPGVWGKKALLLARPEVIAGLDAALLLVRDLIGCLHNLAAAILDLADVTALAHGFTSFLTCLYILRHRSWPEAADFHWGPA